MAPAKGNNTSGEIRNTFYLTVIVVAAVLAGSVWISSAINLRRSSISYMMPVTGPPRSFPACPGSPASLLLGRVRAVLRRAGARRAHEQLAAVRERHVTAVGAALRLAQRVLRLVAADHDLGAGLQRVR